MTTEILEEQAALRPADDDALDAQESDTRMFVTFIAGNEVFAVDMAPVLEIIRVPEVVRVPLAPPSLEGLANLRGKVLPIISLRRIFGFDECEYNDATRAVVIDIGTDEGPDEARITLTWPLPAGLDVEAAGKELIPDD